MDELKDIFARAAKDFVLMPSPAIWEAVKDDIDRRRRKRLIIFWLVVLGMLLTVAVLLYSAVINYRIEEAGVTGRREQTALALNKHLDNTPLEGAFLQHKSSLSKVTPKVKKVVPVRNSYSNTAGAGSLSLQIQPEEYQDTTAGPQTGVLQSLAVIYPRSHSPAIAAPVLQPLQQDVHQNNEISIVEEGLSFPMNEADAVMPVAIQAALDTPDEGNGNIFAPLKDTTMRRYTDTLPTVISIKQHRWGIGICIASGKSYNRLTEADTNKFVARYRNATGASTTDINYGISLHYRLNKRFIISSGIMIDNISEVMQRRQAAYRFDTINGGPFPNIRVLETRIDIEGDSTGTIRNRFTYLSMPLNINYSITKWKKLGVVAGAGINLSYLIGTKGYYYNFDTNVYETITSRQMETWLLSAEGSLGVQYMFRDNISLEIFPYFRIWPSSIYTSSYALNQYFTQAGLKFSVRYFFK